MATEIYSNFKLSYETSLLTTFHNKRRVSKGIRRSKVLQNLNLLIFVFAIFLGGFPPVNPSTSFGYMTLAYYTPSAYFLLGKFWLSISAALFCWSISQSPALQKPFLHKYLQQLGDVSFSLYVIHGTMIRAIGYTMIINAWKLTGRSTTWQYHCGWLLGGIPFYWLVLQVAQIVRVTVEKPSLDLIRRIERYSFEHQR